MSDDDSPDPVKHPFLVPDSERSTIFDVCEKVVVEEHMQKRNEATKRKRGEEEDGEEDFKSLRTSSPSSSSFFPIGSGLGQVAVTKYFPGKAIPKMAGYRTVLIHTSKDGLGGALSPYQLKNEFGHFLENVWQFSKLYNVVDAQRTPKSRFRPHEIIWEHPKELHAEPSSGHPTDEYWKWRGKGMETFYPVRWPNGYRGAKSCVCAIVTENWLKNPDTVDPSCEAPFVRLSYIEARKKIYCAEYARLCTKHADFLKLKSMLQHGENLLIAEVDGPPINQSHRGYPYNRISSSRPGLVLEERVVRFLVEDATFPFGHGYTIGALLLGGEDWIR